MFDETLKSVVEATSGGVGAVIMGYDGIPIDEYIIEDAGFDVQLLSVEYSNVVKEIRRAVEVLKTGMMEEVAITTDLSRVLIRVINEDYFLLLLLAHGGNFGKGRFYLKKYAPLLREYLQ